MSGPVLGGIQARAGVQTYNALRSLAGEIDSVRGTLGRLVKNEKILTTLGDLLDVILTSVVNQQVLSYDSGSDTWINRTITVPVGANPSASVGLVAVNGSSANFMRADAAPALDPAAVVATVTPVISTDAVSLWADGDYYGQEKILSDGGTPPIYKGYKWTSGTNPGPGRSNGDGWLEVWARD